MRPQHRLTPVKIASLKQPGLTADGHGLYLRVAPNGTKSWVFRFMLAGKARDMGLGALHAIPLPDARAKAAACRKLLTEGKDPIETRRQEDAQRLLDQSRSLTFRECGERFIASHESKWRNQKHRAQWKSTLSTYAYPIFGSIAVGAVDTPLVLQAITPLWSEKPETANRLRGRVETVLDWASASGFREGANPARWRGHRRFHLIPLIRKGMSDGIIQKKNTHSTGTAFRGTLPWEGAMAVDWGIVLGVVSVIGIPGGTGIGVAMAARTLGEFRFARACLSQLGASLLRPGYGLLTGINWERAKS